MAVKNVSRHFFVSLLYEGKGYITSLISGIIFRTKGDKADFRYAIEGTFGVSGVPRFRYTLTSFLSYGTSSVDGKEKEEQGTFICSHVSAGVVYFQG